jgi:ketosteroid isomerase-like protein
MFSHSIHRIEPMSTDLKDFDDLINNYIHPADSPEGRATTLAALKSYFRALRAKELETLRTLMTDDVVTEIPFGESGKTDEGSFRVYRGMDQVLDFWATAFKAEGKSHGMTETDITVNADGSRVFIEGRGHLTMASGKTYRNRYVMRFDFVSGRIKHCKEYYNPIQSAYAFGRKIAGQFTIEAL